MIITAIQLQRGSTKTDFPVKQIEDRKEEEKPSLFYKKLKKQCKINFSSTEPKICLFPKADLRATLSCFVFKIRNIVHGHSGQSLDSHGLKVY